MSSQLMDRAHPVTEFAGRLSTRLDQLAGVSTWTMRPEEQRQALKDLAKAEAQLAALRLRVLGEADRSGATDQDAAASAADWVAVETRQTRIAARSDLKLSKALDLHEALAAGLAAGAVNEAQARVIVKALDRLPSSGRFAVTAEHRVRAEEHLVALAADYDAKVLGLLGRHLFRSLHRIWRRSSTGGRWRLRRQPRFGVRSWTCARTTRGLATGGSGSPACSGRSCGSSSRR
jgi:hypothetical protein